MRPHLFPPSDGACDTNIFPQTPISELNGTYSPDPNYPALCPNYSDGPCDPLSKYPCTGGLYLDKTTGNPSNQQPSGHLTDGLNFANNIPKNSQIALLSMGMCNAWLKFGNDNNSFIAKLCNSGKALFCAPGTGRDPSLNPNLVVVNGAQSGKDAVEWAKDPNDPASTAWNNLLKPGGILEQSGVTKEQVQAVWCEHALIFDDPGCPTGCNTICTPFPDHAYKLRDAIEQTLRNIHSVFQNCKIVYISPRAYAYSLDFHNPEPKAYQTGFADKWVILDQLNGLGNIKYKGTNITAPWIAWGPYLWTNGAAPRKDNLTWVCGAPPAYSDVKSDFVHPSSNGVNKVAQQLIAFFKTDPTATPWFLKPASGALTATVTANPSSGTAPLTVGFSATTNHPPNIVNYLWTYDDGESAYNIQNPTRTFTVPGTYSVHFTAVDNTGDTAQKVATVTVM